MGDIATFRKCLPSVTYLRLDGSTPSNSRHNLVNRFNDDPSIDLLLLTTTVGGLGLNLTGADTVIFVEHDWNPMKDLQVCYCSVYLKMNKSLFIKNYTTNSSEDI